MGTVVVTGGTRGIGKAIADAFSVNSEVIVTGTALEPPKGFTGRYHQLDLSDETSLSCFAEYLRMQPALDALVNNAGINVIKPLAELSIADFDRVHQINTRGPMVLTQAVAPKMILRGSGRIVNIASIWSIATKAKRAAYTSAKAGLAGLTRALAAELAPSGLLVNSVSPGFTLTDLTLQSLSPIEMEAITRTIPMGRMAQPEEIARLVRFLGGPDNTYITGQNIVVDGGFTIV